MSKPYYVFKVLFIGDYGVGKSSLLRRYSDNEYSDQYISSIGADFRMKHLTIDNKYTKIQLWDHPRGCERYREITSSYYRHTNGIIYVYDITNIESFKNIENVWYKHYQRYRENYKPNNGNDSFDQEKFETSIIIIGCKSDLRNNTNIDSCVPTEKAREYANSINALFFETSSKYNINIDDSFLNYFTTIQSNYEKANGKTWEQILNDRKTTPYPQSHPNNNKSWCSIN